MLNSPNPPFFPDNAFGTKAGSGQGDQWGLDKKKKEREKRRKGGGKGETKIPMAKLQRFYTSTNRIYSLSGWKRFVKNSGDVFLRISCTEIAPHSTLYTYFLERDRHVPPVPFLNSNVHLFDAAREKVDRNVSTIFKL